MWHMYLDTLLWPCSLLTSITALLAMFLSPQGMYVFMHAVKGTPFETPDQGKARLLTHWEQLDYGVQFTSSRKFFTISPIILYVLDIVRFCLYTCNFKVSSPGHSHWQIFLVLEEFYFLFFFQQFVCFAPQILPGKFLHKVWHDTLCHKHCLTFERPDPQAATTTRSETFRHQQVLSYRTCCVS